MTTTRSLRQLLAAGAVILSLHGIALGSPTAEEFLPCHRLAAEVLQRCLDERPGYANDACWEQARSAQQRCYRDVSRAHVPDKARIEAERKASAKTDL